MRTEATILNNLAWFLLDPGDGMEADPSRARQLAEAALSRAGGPNPAYLDTLARAYWQLGDTEEALRHQRHAARLDPSDDHIRSTLEEYEQGAQ